MVKCSSSSSGVVGDKDFLVYQEMKFWLYREMHSLYRLWIDSTENLLVVASIQTVGCTYLEYMHELYHRI